MLNSQSIKNNRSKKHGAWHNPKPGSPAINEKHKRSMKKKQEQEQLEKAQNWQSIKKARSSHNPKPGSPTINYLHSSQLFAFAELWVVFAELWIVIRVKELRALLCSNCAKQNLENSFVIANTSIINFVMNENSKSSSWINTKDARVVTFLSPSRFYKVWINVENKFSKLISVAKYDPYYQPTNKERSHYQ